MSNKIKILLWLTLSSFISMSYAGSCLIKDVTKQIEQKLDGIDYYQVNVTSTLNNQQSAQMQLYGKRPDLLKAIMKISETDKLTIVFDKQYEWIEEGSSVYQIDLSKLTRHAERPFDTPYSLAGGLLSGEDYVGTIKTFLKVYDFKISCKANTITLTGNLNIDRFTHYTQSRNIAVPIDVFVAQFADTLGKATLTVDKNSYLVTGYVLQGKDKSATFTVNFSNYHFDPLTAEQLSFKLPEGTKPIDITPGVKSSEPVPATDGETQSTDD